MQPWNYFEKMALIQEIRKHPVLWDINHKKHNNRFHMAAAWKKLVNKFNISEKLLKDKWKSLRDIFKREMKKYYSYTTQKYKGRWEYFQHMAFLLGNYLEDEDSNDGYPIEFIVEKESDSENQTEEELPSDDNDDAGDNSENLNRTEVSHGSLVSEDKEIKPEDDEVIKEFLLDNEYVDQISENPEDTEHEDNVSEQPYPGKRKRVENINYDIMFLKSLAPFFKELHHLRKLVMRSKIQDLLLQEIADQYSCNLTDS